MPGIEEFSQGLDSYNDFVIKLGKLEHIAEIRTEFPGLPDRREQIGKLIAELHSEFPEHSARYAEEVRNQVN